MKVITFSGKAESGKDASALLIKAKLESRGKRCIIVHYADYLKFICIQYYNWNGVKDAKGREILQRIGTDLIRKKNPDFWVNAIINLLTILESDYDYVLIPDTRFPNEILRIRKKFPCISALVIRPNYENSLTPEQRSHLSEISLDGYEHLFHHKIISESGLENLSIAVDKFIEKFKL